jgi:GNAT superfamily N-acetyltransferase
MQNNIEYIETDRQGLDSIGFLWEKLNEHHRVHSPHHAGHFTGMTFEQRKRQFLEKSVNGSIRIDLANDIKTGKLVGYCVSTITEDKLGEIDSIYVEEDYRRHGLGDSLMKKALAWMDGLSINRRLIAVAFGNEEVFPFYARYGFYPRGTLLTEIEK